ncbi:hypothetical protein [Pseudonocardia sp. N23]|uniref:hypothetical protein n=1 Tax=Pseudonocardia sp. N23 TaxID=1987376 RepID=UPI000C030477|nr:hypothetical protein [Pseudonocardia sp. N23]GAY12583.1 potassium-transporting ATPase A chain [Pseudonocardia sp. N23]
MQTITTQTITTQTITTQTITTQAITVGMPRGEMSFGGVRWPVRNARGGALRARRGRAG